MTTKTELKAKIKELQAQHEKLQAQYDAMPDEPEPLFEVAGKCDNFWFVNYLLKVSLTNYSYNSFEGHFIKTGNHFTDKAEADRMAAFIRQNFLYWRMALRFAEGYEFEVGKRNGYVYVYEDSGESIRPGYIYNCKDSGVIYMSEQNASRFAEFCNEHKKELGL